ncbi:hypothetical protein DI270_007630 [Microbispora triticiradicis]|uniref:Uncharacterized protein n=1 Tax=Microbispora triticiradicis TaxID=2200763 RepID=A0ABX9LNK1_9ACTN|nr:hypothetical protein [Microbispora triticiradicis]RGA05574.1 hypothetical protein DI270_007630 [Microbispora triticiradicis]
METLEALIRRNERTSRAKYEAAAAELTGQLDRRYRLTSTVLQEVTYAQAHHVWWDMVLMQTDKYDVEVEEALGLVRAWTTRYVETALARAVPVPRVAETGGTAADLFEHALSVTGLEAGHRFLSATEGGRAAS